MSWKRRIGLYRWTRARPTTHSSLPPRNQQQLAALLARFENAELRAVVMGEPWDTNLVWIDAASDLEGFTVEERDAAVVEMLLSFCDQGWAIFYRIENFDETYLRIPTADELMTRNELVGALVEGNSYPVLGIRSTERGRNEYFRREPDARLRWEQTRG